MRKLKWELYTPDEWDDKPDGKLTCSRCGQRQEHNGIAEYWTLVEGDQLNSDEARRLAIVLGVDAETIMLCDGCLGLSRVIRSTGDTGPSALLMPPGNIVPEHGRTGVYYTPEGWLEDFEAFEKITHPLRRE